MLAGTRMPLLCTLAACAAIEIVFFVWLSSLGVNEFLAFVSSADTPSYLAIAQGLVEKRDLVPSPRTLGYPLFLVLGYIIGGKTHAMHVVIAAQLLLNLLMTWGCWRLFEKFLPDIGIHAKIAATLFFFWAGMGMALYLLTDFTASFFFSVFLFGLLFWRRRVLVAIAATSLTLATLVRPTFTFIPFLVPIAAYLVGRSTEKVPPSQTIAYILASILATGISVAYQYGFQGYAGPSPVLAKNIARTLHTVAKEKGLSKEDYDAFNDRIARRAGKPYATISPSEEEKFAVELFREELRSRPGALLIKLFETSIKYVFAPIESLIIRLIAFITDDNRLFTYARIFLTALCLPVWLLAVMPPLGSGNRRRVYYSLVMLFLIYLVGITAINPFQGERIRFPVLAFMLPVVGWNAHEIYRKVRTVWLR
jgi:hypothetical protein